MSVRHRVRVLIVDDEPVARSGLHALLRRDPDVEVVGECPDGQTAIGAITDLRPDVVLLDVQMPELDGFDVVRAIGPERMPIVIFVTAFDRFALEAFDVNALDYVLKPFSDERFAVAVQRAKRALHDAQAGDLRHRLVALLDTVGATRGVAPEVGRVPQSDYLTRLVVKSAGRISFVRADEIDWIEAADYCVKLHAGGRVHVIRDSMRSLEDRLDPEQFFRVHRSAIVNLERLQEIRRSSARTHDVVLHGGTVLQLSQRNRAKLERLLNQEI